MGLDGGGEEIILSPQRYHPPFRLSNGIILCSAKRYYDSVMDVTSTVFIGLGLLCFRIMN